MRKRKENLTDPAKFLFKKQLLGFFAQYYENFKLAEECKSTGNTWDWKTAYVPAWRSFVCISIIYRIIAAKRSVPHWSRSSAPTTSR